MPAVTSGDSQNVTTQLTETAKHEPMFSAIELNFLIVGALFAAVVVLAILNLLIHFVDKSRKSEREGSMAALGDRSRMSRSGGGRGGGGGSSVSKGARATLFF